MSHTRRLRLALVPFVAAIAFGGLAAPARAAVPADTLGTFRGAANVGGIQAYEAWRGRPVHRVLDFLADDDWGKIAAPTWWVNTWSASPYRTRLIYSVPLLPRTGGTLAQGARGDFNAHFRKLAQLLVAKGQGGVTLRLGWEFNGNWYRWNVGVPNGPANYAAYWRQIVTTMRAVPGAAFKFDWCTNNGSVPYELNPENAYPGDAYVDYIAQDVYDQAWPATGNAATRWKQIRTKRYGLDWLVAFAAKHGKRVAVPEWGLGYDANGGGDAPYFVARMHEWLAARNVAYSNQWEYTDTPRLMTGRNPRSAVEFLRRFGADPIAANSARHRKHRRHVRKRAASR